MRSKQEGLELWKKLGNIPQDENGSIDEDFEDLDGFVLFEKGTMCEDIWHWFEEEFEGFVVHEVMYNDEIKGYESK